MYHYDIIIVIVMFCKQVYSSSVTYKDIYHLTNNNITEYNIYISELITYNVY